jgi:hypothetical protein
MISKWIDEALKEAMEAIEKGMHSLKGARRAWNIPVTYLFDHLVKKTRSRKMGPRMLTKEKDQTVIAWTLGMQECGLFITLQQLVM